MKKISFRAFTMGIFAVLSLFVIFSILYTHINFSEKFTKKVANIQFDILTNDFNHEMFHLTRTNESYVNILSSLLEDATMEKILKNKKKYMKIFAKFLNEQENIYSLYGARDDDSFFSMRRVKKNENVLNKYKAKDTDLWYTRDIYKGVETRTYYDKNYVATYSDKVQAKYKPTQRPWYKNAIKSQNKPVRTAPYVFNLSGKYKVATMGITYSKEYKKGYVFSFDLLLKDTDKMLELGTNLDTQHSCIMSNDFKIVAKTKDLDYDIVRKIFQVSQKDKKNGITTIKGVKYIYSIIPFKDDYLISFANFDILMKPYENEIKKSLGFGLIVTIILCLIVWFLASIVSKPILLLSRENKKIAKRNFHDVKQVKSSITEISDLSSSLVEMAQSIKKYQEKLEIISTTDTLTKISNRNKLDTKLRIYLEDFARYKHKFGFMIADIDYFKNVNDTYGHLVGDEVLVEFVQQLLKNVRINDVVGRWGGEEFVIICKEISAENLVKLAEKIRKNIEKHKFKTIGKKTASFGITVCKEGDTVEDIVKRADKALYEAKEGGRNLVVLG